LRCPDQGYIKLGRQLAPGRSPALGPSDSGKRKKGLEMDPIDCTPPEYILPGSRERPLCPLQPQNRDWKVGLTRGSEEEGPWWAGGVPRDLAPSCLAVPAAPAVSKSTHHERLEPTPWESQDARGPHVSVCDHSRGPASQHHCFHEGLLPEPVSPCWIHMCPCCVPHSRFES
jgi:hypothetical protein